MRIVQISDTHVTSRGGPTNENLRALIRFLNEEVKPDLVVHSGDLIALTPGTVADFDTARELLDDLKAPLRVLPGNHDVGESGAHPWMGFVTDAEHVAEFRSRFGQGYWVELLGDDWAAVGVSDELFGSGLEAEGEQWTWLEETIPTLAGRKVALFLHKPLWSPLPEGAVIEHTVAVEAEDAERLLALFDQGQLRVVGSGHLHRYRLNQRGEVAEVWAPGTAFVVKQAADQPSTLQLGAAGLNQLGLVEYRLNGGAAEAYFRSPLDLRELDIREIPEMIAEIRELEEKHGISSNVLEPVEQSA